MVEVTGSQDPQLQEASLHVLCNCLSADSAKAGPPVREAGGIAAAAQLLSSDVADVQVRATLCSALPASGFTCTTAIDRRGDTSTCGLLHRLHLHAKLPCAELSASLILGHVTYTQSASTTPGFCCVLNPLS